MIETETKKHVPNGSSPKTPPNPGVPHFSRPSVRPCVFFDVRPRFSMSVRVFQCPSAFFFNVHPSVSIFPTKNNQKSTKTQNDILIEKTAKNGDSLFSCSDLYNAVLTRLPRIDRAGVPLSICAIGIKNGEV